MKNQFRQYEASRLCVQGTLLHMFVRGVGQIEVDLRDWPSLLKKVADRQHKLCRVWIMNPSGIGDDLEFELDVHIEVQDLVLLHRERRERMNLYSQLKILKYSQKPSKKPSFPGKGPKKFFEKFLDHEVDREEIYAAISEWHNDESLNGTSIYQHLSMTFDQYEILIRYPEKVEALRRGG